MGLALALYCLVCVVEVYRPRPDFQGGGRSGHGLWLGHRWFDDRRGKPVTPGEQADLLRHCQRSGVGDLFLHVGPVDREGKLPPWDAKKWRTIRPKFDQQRCLAWVGGLNSEFFGQAEDTVCLKNARWRRQLLDQLEALLGQGFDGVHYDFEPIREGDEGLIDLIRETRARFPGRLISVATPQLRPWCVSGSLPYLGWLWSRSFYTEVARHVDQVVLMGYDTLQPTSWLYTRYLAYQVSSLRDLPCQLMVGVPSYEDNQPFHNAQAETLAAGLEGARHGGAHYFALYCEWTTTPGEWRDWEAFIQSNSDGSL